MFGFLEKSDLIAFFMPQDLEIYALDNLSTFLPTEIRVLILKPSKLYSLPFYFVGKHQQYLD